MNITGDFVLQVKASCNPETLDLLNDTYRFLFSHHHTISESAMHTYYSALPFTPHNTRLYHLYEQETIQSINVLQGLSPTWTSYLSSWSLDGFYRTILSISPDGMWLAAGRDGKIMILDAQTTAPQCQISLTNYIACLAFSPSESTLATVTYESLQLWNTTTGINQKTQMLSGADFHAVAFSSQGQYILLSIDQSLHLHHGIDASELSVLSTDWSHQTILFTHDDMQIITGSKEGYIHFFTFSGNQLSEIQERRIFNETEVRGLVLRHDGRRLALRERSAAIRIYDLPSGSHIATLGRPGDQGCVTAMAYHPTEEELAAGDFQDVGLWRQKETPSDWVRSFHSHRYASSISAIAYCQNGTRIYTCTESGKVKLFTTSVAQVQEPPKHRGGVRCCAVNQPMSLLATGSWDGSTILWNITTGDYQRTVRGGPAPVDSLRFSDDGVLLASRDWENRTTVWDVASGSCLRALRWHNINVSEFNEDNAHLTSEENAHLTTRADEWIAQGMSVDEAHTTPYSLKDLNGWKTVVEQSQQKRCKYGLCRLQGEDAIRDSFIFGDRAVFLCASGRVLILDISRVMQVYTDPAVWLDHDPGSDPDPDSGSDD